MFQRLVAVAPMMDWTDRHYRYFLRLISRQALLYTEMVTTGALLHGDVSRLLDFHADEHPLALQLGGSEPKHLAACAKLGAVHGYDEINLNVGCPSERVQTGRFGACLMAEPELVADGIKAMVDAVTIPVTVKTRIGIDEQDSYEALTHFIGTVAAAGCDTFIIHARKAWLNGLSPKENREIPPLRYDVALRLKTDFPALAIVLNGGIKTFAQIQTHLQDFDGVMIGREAYHNPYLLADVDSLIYSASQLPLARATIIERFIPYLEQQLQAGIRLNHLTRHILGLFHGQPGGRAWRRYISEHAHKTSADITVLNNALKLVC